MRRRIDTTETAALASPDYVAPDGRQWVSREAWEVARKLHAAGLAWDGGLAAPDEPFDVEDL